jgi:copper(I)-binding protein
MLPRLICLALLLCACAEAPGIAVEEARIRDLLPGRDTTAGYFTLRNNTRDPLVLVGASSPHARTIEMHITVTDNDRVSMRKSEQHTLAPGERLRFEPGGPHLMIFGVAKVIDPFPITLLFSDGEQAKASFSKLLN